MICALRSSSSRAPLELAPLGRRGSRVSIVGLISRNLCRCMSAFLCQNNGRTRSLARSELYVQATTLGGMPAKRRPRTRGWKSTCHEVHPAAQRDGSLVSNAALFARCLGSKRHTPWLLKRLVRCAAKRSLVEYHLLLLLLLTVKRSGGCSGAPPGVVGKTS